MACPRPGQLASCEGWARPPRLRRQVPRKPASGRGGARAKPPLETGSAPPHCIPAKVGNAHSGVAHYEASSAKEKGAAAEFGAGGAVWVSRSPVQLSKRARHGRRPPARHRRRNEKEKGGGARSKCKSMKYMQKDVK